MMHLFDHFLNRFNGHIRTYWSVKYNGSNLTVTGKIASCAVGISFVFTQILVYPAIEVTC
ncbi:Uncharacterised protein [Vibrio cholerae]|nr:Uncharacterised protein [Vibrio cholerae]CSD19419.1 Uncharacterised protein [Vibrio cholerae]